MSSECVGAESHHQCDSSTQLQIIREMGIDRAQLWRQSQSISERKPEEKVITLHHFNWEAGRRCRWLKSRALLLACLINKIFIWLLKHRFIKKKPKPMKISNTTQRTQILRKFIHVSDFILFSPSQVIMKYLVCSCTLCLRSQNHQIRTSVKESSMQQDPELQTYTTIVLDTCDSGRC